jgi:5-methylcytosine-specific restriction enzyme subunit McrC
MQPKLFTVSEHRPLTIGDTNNKGQWFEESDLEVLTEYHGVSEQGIPYFSLGHRCVWFCEYVGVLQIGYLTIEVLPKIDSADNSEWRNKLIQILHNIHGFDISVTGNSLLTLRSNSILDYYFALFVTETKKLLHQGLVKKYRSIDVNSTALKGKLLISKHTSYNCVHQERFYVRHTTYDRHNGFNQILYKTLRLIQAISRNSAVHTSAGALLLDFPEMSDIKVSEELFDRLRFDRKTEAYKAAIGIAKLLLLHYHPDIRQGKANVLALMFDMNLLWEKFVFVTLRKHLKDYTVNEQVTKPYWKMEGHRSVSLKPDIKLTKKGQTYIIDTKWKLIEKGKPAYQDLQQMFAYTKYFSSLHTLLLYPGSKHDLKKGFFYHETDKDKSYPCSVGTIALTAKDSISKWQVKITNQVRNYVQGQSA